MERLNYFYLVKNLEQQQNMVEFYHKLISPVFLLTIFVDCPIYIPILKTEPSPTITPSTTSDIAPKKTLSSIIVGNACAGSKTPPTPATCRDMTIFSNLRTTSCSDLQKYLSLFPHQCMLLYLHSMALRTAFFAYKRTTSFLLEN